MDGILIALIIGGTVSVSMYFAYLGSKAKYRTEAAANDAVGKAPTREELDAVQQQLAELAERVDFTERLLAQQRDAQRLDPPRG